MTKSFKDFFNKKKEYMSRQKRYTDKEQINDQNRKKVRVKEL